MIDLGFSVTELCDRGPDISSHWGSVCSSVPEDDISVQPTSQGSWESEKRLWM